MENCCKGDRIAVTKNSCVKVVDLDTVLNTYHGLPKMGERKSYTQLSIVRVQGMRRYNCKVERVTSRYSCRKSNRSCANYCHKWNNNCENK